MSNGSFLTSVASSLLVNFHGEVLVISMKNLALLFVSSSHTLNFRNAPTGTFLVYVLPKQAQIGTFLSLKSNLVSCNPFSICVPVAIL